jgi:hypothetical protein
MAGPVYRVKCEVTQTALQKFGGPLPEDAPVGAPALDAYTIWVQPIKAGDASDKKLPANPQPIAITGIPSLTGITPGDQFWLTLEKAE